MTRVTVLRMDTLVLGLWRKWLARRGRYAVSVLTLNICLIIQVGLHSTCSLSLFSLQLPSICSLVDSFAQDELHSAVLGWQKWLHFLPTSLTVFQPPHIYSTSCDTVSGNERVRGKQRSKQQLSHRCIILLRFLFSFSP